MPATADALTVTLNGLEIALDRETGSILGLTYPGAGTLLREEPGSATLLDLAYPVPTFEPLRLASRFSPGAEIAHSDSGVVIAWARLGASRDIPLSGPVSASVRLDALPDGRSIAMSCEVQNDSDRPVRQVLFPDFAGLVRVAGPSRTILKTGGFGSAPFDELKLSESDEFYAESNAFRSYASGGMFSNMWMRWFDLGNLSGGMSLFPKLWGWDERSSLLLHLSPTTDRLRLSCVHPITVAPGESWKSEEWVLTPHTQGWAKGIEPYRDFARAHIHRKQPIPEHINKGLGFRTAWMCQVQPDDPAGDAVWKFSDLPAMAKEAADHGLNEMVLWGTHHGFTLPLPQPFAHLGTEAELSAAVAKCRSLGVNVAPFISILQANKATGPRYGLTVPETGGWTYHTEMLPRFNPPYGGAYACAQVDTAHPQWQADALEFCKHLVDIGIPSLSWDQFHAVKQEPNIPTLVAQVREYSRARAPESTFSAEELWNIEIDCEYLDYTWNWGGYRDAQAYHSVFPGPRRNLNINRSVWEVKRGFLDGFFLNVWPAKPGGVNGSDWIANNAALSDALKHCAKLRAQFVEYFTDGVFIAGCIQTAEVPGVHLAARVLPGRALLLFTNEGGAGPVTFPYDIAPWLSSPSGRYGMKCYGADGELLETTEIKAGPASFTSPPMAALETRACEIVAVR